MSKGPNVQVKRFAENNLSGFKGNVTPCTIKGPAVLYRFSGAPEGAGEWWIPEGTYLMIYGEARDNASRSFTTTTSTEFQRLYRKYLAISLDWNDLLKFFRMDIPAEAVVPGWQGAAKKQLLVSAEEQDRLGRTVTDHLSGGLDQIFVEQYDLNWVKKVAF